MRMTLVFAKVDFEFCGFTNMEYDIMKPLLHDLGLRDFVNGPMPAVHIDGQVISDTAAVCRYIGQTRGLYPDPTNALAVLKLDNLIAGAEGLFNNLIVHHYNRYTKKAGVKVKPFDPEDRKKNGENLSQSIKHFFLFIQKDYVKSG
jgi:glutathione S-transferase